MDGNRTFDGKSNIGYPLIPYVITPHLAYYQACCRRTGKTERCTGGMFLDFEVNKVDIRPEYSE